MRKTTEENINRITERVAQRFSAYGKEQPAGLRIKELVEYVVALAEVERRKKSEGPNPSPGPEEREPKPYTALRALLARTDILYHDCGPASENLGNQVHIEIADEQDTSQGVELFFDIGTDGSEEFVCQE